MADTGKLDTTAKRSTERKVQRQSLKPLRRVNVPQASGGTPAPSPKLTRFAYAKLLSAIVQGRLEFGEPLSENDLACALHLSKAPIRESLNELRLRGLVEVVSRSGSYVFSPTAEQITELCEYRTLLESNALRISMARHPKALVMELTRIVSRMREAMRAGDVLRSNELDKEFHRSIIIRSDNRYLTESYENIGLTVEALRYRVMSTSAYHGKVQDEHTKIVELLADGQIARAVRILESHIQRVRRIQSTAEWGPGRLPRRNYRFRDLSEILI